MIRTEVTENQAQAYWATTGDCPYQSFTSYVVQSLRLINLGVHPLGLEAIHQSLSPLH